MVVYGHKINQAARVFSKQLNERLSPLGLYSAQWGVILRLSEHGACTQTELSDYLCVEPPTMTRTLARMAESGWIVRETGADRRERKVCLTKAASEKFRSWQQASDELEAKALQNIDEQELAVFNRVIEQMMNNLSRKEVKDE
ncbi:MarR family winged helix-turn-helix transcriptional regulator [Brevibacillus massiliensis]|uniref:MarR family winged helix-turn-helix transcriptional regulator n=1 Tax=Brevibacillus massiliensis TaxID=1118054 RepID=UPI00030DA410|nr:MarR family transcriptional regulator [Brevibacillus massiliensis]